MAVFPIYLSVKTNSYFSEKLFNIMKRLRYEQERELMSLSFKGKGHENCELRVIE
jgi:hypothetical protein